LEWNFKNGQFGKVGLNNKMAQIWWKSSF